MKNVKKMKRKWPKKKMNLTGSMALGWPLAATAIAITTTIKVEVNIKQHNFYINKPKQNRIWCSYLHHRERNSWRSEGSSIFTRTWWSGKCDEQRKGKHGIRLSRAWGRIRNRCKPCSQRRRKSAWTLTYRISHSSNTSSRRIWISLLIHRRAMIFGCTR